MAVANGNYVGVNVTLTATDTANDIVVKDNSAQGYGVEVADPVTASKDDKYEAYTKVTFGIQDKDANIKANHPTMSTMVVVCSGQSGDDAVVGIASETEVMITGTATNGVNIVVSPTTTISNATAGTAAAAPTGIITVGDVALTITQA